MRCATTLFIAFLFIVISFTACSQTIKIIKVNPTEVKGYNRENSADNGVRTLEVTLRLSGKASTTKFPLAIDAGSAASEPKLVDEVIPVDAAAFPKKRKSTNDVTYKVNIKLSGLDCFKSDETFESIAI